MTDLVSVYMTVATHPEAVTVARTIVEENLAACANILPAVHSIYRWEGKVEQTEEAAIIAKTRADLFERLEERVKALHAYSCPCIVAWPIMAGHGPYLDWIVAKTTR